MKTAKADRILRLIEITEAQKSNASDGTNRHLTLQLRLDFLVSAYENYIYNNLNKLGD